MRSTPSQLPFNDHRPVVHTGTSVIKHCALLLAERSTRCSVAGNETAGFMRRTISCQVYDYYQLQTECP